MSIFYPPRPLCSPSSFCFVDLIFQPSRRSEPPDTFVNQPNSYLTLSPAGSRRCRTCTAVVSQQRRPRHRATDSSPHLSMHTESQYRFGVKLHGSFRPSENASSLVLQFRPMAVVETALNHYAFVRAGICLLQRRPGLRFAPPFTGVIQTLCSHPLTQHQKASLHLPSVLYRPVFLQTNVLSLFSLRPHQVLSPKRRCLRSSLTMLSRRPPDSLIHRVGLRYGYNKAAILLTHGFTYFPTRFLYLHHVWIFACVFSHRIPNRLHAAFPFCAYVSATRPAFVPVRWQYPIHTPYRLRLSSSPFIPPTYPGQISHPETLDIRPRGFPQFSCYSFRHS